MFHGLALRLMLKIRIYTKVVIHANLLWMKFWQI